MTARHGTRVWLVQPPRDQVLVSTTESKAAAAAGIGAGLAGRKRAELLGLLRSCFVRAEPWLQAGKCVAALGGQLPDGIG